MTTLAQAIIENDGREWTEDRLGPRGVNIAQLLQRRLANRDMNSLAPFVQHAGNALPPVERFVFPDNAPDAVWSLIESGSLDHRVVMRSARMPVESAWIEWLSPDPDTTRALRIGVLLDAAMLSEPRYLGDPATMACIVAAMSPPEPERCLPVVMATIRPPPVNAGVESCIRWSLGRHQGSGEEDTIREFESALRDAVYCLFLITTPRVCEVRDVVHNAKLQKARAKRGKLPLIEYKHVTLKVGVGSPQYRSKGGGTGNGTPEHHKRLHQVMGHFRTYEKDRETPLVSWVPPHWRGDAELGIVLHERKVER